MVSLVYFLRLLALVISVKLEFQLIVWLLIVAGNVDDGNDATELLVTAAEEVNFVELSGCFHLSMTGERERKKVSSS